MVRCAGCTGRRKVGQLLCRTCWHALPNKVRYPLFQSWRAAYRNLSDQSLWDRYMQDRRVALLALRDSR